MDPCYSRARRVRLAAGRIGAGWLKSRPRASLATEVHAHTRQPDLLHHHLHPSPLPDCSIPVALPRLKSRSRSTLVTLSRVSEQSPHLYTHRRVRLHPLTADRSPPPIIPICPAPWRPKPSARTARRHRDPRPYPLPSTPATPPNSHDNRLAHPPRRQARPRGSPGLESPRRRLAPSLDTRPRASPSAGEIRLLPGRVLGLAATVPYRAGLAVPDRAPSFCPA